MKLTVILLVVILFTGCKKNGDKVYTIQGQILESSSNTIPVSNYTISFYQSSSSGLLGGVSGFNTTVRTGNDGKFTFQYNPNQNYGLIQGGTNRNDIFIAGVDTIKHKNLYPEWYSVSSLADVNLNTLYLFKKIGTLVRKVQFTNSLNTGESLEVITTDSSGASYKTLMGPIASGTLLTVDTIRNCKISEFNLLTREYIFLAVLRKPSFQKDLNVTMTEGDEAYREILMTY